MRLFLTGAFMLLLSCGNETEFTGNSGNRGSLPVEVEEATIRKTFTTGNSESATLEVSGNLDTLKQQFTLFEKSETIRDLFRQENRSPNEQEFQQGSRGELMEEKFNQTQLGILDIVLVVDNSVSMSEEHANLSDRLGPLLSFIKDSNWRIGVTTTDPRDGCLTKVFRASTKNLEAAFQSTIRSLGVRGSNNERGILQASNALHCPGNEWIRKDSNIAVLIVSDEDNCSNGNGCQNTAYASENYLYTALTTGPHYRELGKSAKIYGLYSIPGTRCPSARRMANIYHRAVQRTEGVAGSICSDDFSDTLERISKDLLQSLILQFPLTHTPRLDTLEVRVNGEVLREGFQIIDKRLVFSEPPPQNADILVRYYHGENTLRDQFAIGEQVDPDTLKVFVNEKEMDSINYQYEPTGGFLTFKEPPMDSATIRVEFKPSGILKNTFDLSQIPADDLLVKLKGVPLDPSQYEFDPVTSKLTLGFYPEDNADLEVSYLSQPIPEYVYTLGFEPTDEMIFSAHFEDDPSSPVIFERDGRTFTISPEAFSPGRVITILVREPEAAFGEVSLPAPPLPGNWRVAQLPSPCALEDIQLINHVFEISCGFSPEETLIIEYTLAPELRRSFVIESIDDPEQYIYQVFLDGKRTSQFERHGPEIRLTGDLKPDQVVEVLLIGL